MKKLTFTVITDDNDHISLTLEGDARPFLVVQAGATSQCADAWRGLLGAHILDQLAKMES